MYEVFHFYHHFSSNDTELRDEKGKVVPMPHPETKGTPEHALALALNVLKERNKRVVSIVPLSSRYDTFWIVTEVA